MNILTNAKKMMHHNTQEVYNECQKALQKTTPTLRKNPIN